MLNCDQPSSQSKNCTLLYFYILSHLLSFWNNLHLPPHLPFFFFHQIPQPCFHKSYLQSKTLLNMRPVPSSAVFCSNAVLIATPSSMYFSSFFDVPLPSTPTTTGMTLMLLKFHTPFFSLVPGISQFFPSLFHSYVSRYSNINYGTTFLILIH